MSSTKEAIGGPKCGCSASCCKGSSYTEKVKKEKPKKQARTSSQNNRSVAGSTQAA